jgi:hypothetical protein
MRLIAYVFTLIAAGLVASQGANLTVPNHSFEQPPVPPETPAYPVHVAWQQTPKRADYVENPPFTWNVLTGVFPNSAAGATDHLPNMDGAQAAYLFAERENGIFQMLDTTFATGTSYTLKVSLVGSANIPPTTGSTLDLMLYYTNANGTIVSAGATTVTYNTTSFPDTAQFRDFSVKVPAKLNSDPAIGKKIGIMIKSTAAEAGGVWDIDNVRVVAEREFVQVPNFSFENPTVPAGVPASPVFNNWQKFPKPAYWDEGTMGAWDNLTGIFPNPGADQPGHIDNIDRNQAAYLFATPGSGIYQDLTTRYELDQTYTITAGIIGSTAIPPTNNTPITIALYYRDAESNMVTVASKTVAFNTENFPNATRMVDFAATSRTVSSLAPWLGKNIGVYVASAAGFDQAGGVWDVDNIRITVDQGVRLSIARQGADLRISWETEAGVQYQLMKADRVSSAPGDYTFAPFGNTVAGTGGVVFTTVPMTDTMAFFEVRAPVTP